MKVRRPAYVKREAGQLYDEGHTVTEITAILGVPRSTVSAWLDPWTYDKQRSRRRRYQGKCIACGAPTDGSNGFASATKRCSACSLARQRATRYWTRERLIEAIRRWNDIYGFPPSATMWRRTDYERGFPCSGMVYQGGVFNSWDEAIRAAGLEPRGIGNYPRTAAYSQLLRELRG